MYIYIYNYVSIYLSVCFVCLRISKVQSMWRFGILLTILGFAWNGSIRIIQVSCRHRNPNLIVLSHWYLGKSRIWCQNMNTYINYIHILIYSTICMIKSFLKFNVHMCINTPRMKNIWKNISCRSQFHYFFRGKNHGKNPIFHDKNHGFL